MGELLAAGAAECGHWQSIVVMGRVVFSSCHIAWPQGSVCLSSVSWQMAALDFG